MSTDLEQVTKALTEFNTVAAGLDVLKKNYSGILFDVETYQGMEHAKAARAVLRKPRYEIERIRKEAKAPLLAIGKKLDEEAKRITNEIMALEGPIDQQIKNEEERKEREKREKAEAEAKRVADIQARIDGIRMMPSHAAGKSSAEAKAVLEQASAIVIDDAFAEFQMQASSALQTTIAALQGIHAERLNYEAEQARIAAEREELARLRAEQEKRETAERARIAEEERVAKAARDAEAARQAEALRAEREKLDAERAEQAKRDAEARAAIEEQRRLQQAKIDEENLRLAAERQKFEQEQAQIKRQAEEAERSRKAAEEAERKKRDDAEKLAKKSKYPGDQAILDVLTQHFGVPEPVVRSWFVQLKQSVAA